MCRDQGLNPGLLVQKFDTVTPRPPGHPDTIYQVSWHTLVLNGTCFDNTVPDDGVDVIRRNMS
uniref:Uncharacterized protein n=1 Tax=Timema monikensis TaxID=170555 RepID=A0A7R9EIH8_9NEOP|nr:unnamed protein product [Timema monikensis]